MVLREKEKADRKEASGGRASGVITFVIMFLLSCAVTARGADQPASGSSESSKKCIDRVKIFLMRANEDADRSLAHVQETRALLEEQGDTIGLIEREKAAGRRGELLEWYRRYADWLKGMDADAQADVADYFSHPRPDAGTISRYDDITRRYQRLADTLGRITEKLEDDRNKIETRVQRMIKAVQDRRVLVEKEDLGTAKELRPHNRERPSGYREAVYKDLTDDEREGYRRELKSLGEQRTYLNGLSEISQYELNWISMKSEDSASLDSLGSVIGSEATGPINDAIRSIIKTYESDVRLLKRSVDEIRVKLYGTTRTGSLMTLDRLDELSRSYEKMRTRYERHIEWLKGQIGGYQADLIELAKER